MDIGSAVTPVEALKLTMVAEPLMGPVNLPIVDKIQSKGDKFVVNIKDIKATGDSKLIWGCSINQIPNFFLPPFES